MNQITRKGKEEDQERMYIKLNQPLPLFDKEPMKFKNYFDRDYRRRIIGEEYLNMEELVKNAFYHLFMNYRNKLFSNLNSITDHNLYNKILEASSGMIATTADEIFGKYIVGVFPQANKEYFLFVVKFVVLFRECINISKSDISGEFTSTGNTENVPDMCNEFITEFMETNEFFGLDLNELIEIIQHFCNWLYENKFTTSRLTLLS